MKTSWADASKEEKATEACQVICNVICPSDGQNLFQAVQEHKRDCNLDFSTAAYRNTTSKKIKTQIFAYEYPASKLIEIHSSFEKLSKRQIKKARAHAKTFGPGTPVETTKKHRILFEQSKGRPLYQIFE